MKKYFLLFLLLLSLLPDGGAARVIGQEELQIEFNIKIEGYITEIDQANNLIFIDGIRYQVAKEPVISLNDRPVSLQALKAPANGFYKWGEFYLDVSGRVLRIDAYYRVVEGIIEEISRVDNSLLLLEYRQDNSSGEILQRYFLPEKGADFNDLKEKDHVILIIARDRILSILLSFP